MSIEDKIAQNKVEQELLREEGRKLQAEKEAGEVTYSIGDRFTHDKNKFMLFVSGNGGVILASLRTGHVWSGINRVDNSYKITALEFRSITSGCDFTRYWDSGRGIGYEY